MALLPALSVSVPAAKVPFASSLSSRLPAAARATRAPVAPAAFGAAAAVAAAGASGKRSRGSRRSNQQLPRQAYEKHLPELTAEEAQKLAGGQRVQRQERSGGTGHGFVVVDVEAPASLSLKCLESFKDYPEMIPVVRSADVLSQTDEADGPAAKCSYRISKFWLGVHARHRVDRTAGTLSFELDESCPRLVLHEASGYWRIEPLGPDKCRVWLCVTRLRASPLVPKCIIDYAADRALRRATGWLQPVLSERWLQARQSEKKPKIDSEVKGEVAGSPLVPSTSTFCAA